MSATTRWAVRLGLVLIVSAGPCVAQAQEAAARRVSFDTVVGVQDFFGEQAEWPTQVMLDAFVAAELRPGLQVSFRPLAWRVGGEWEPLVDQLSVRYEFQTPRGVNLRLEGGRFPSPIGLGMTENRASLNAGIIWCHRPYYTPLPSQGGSVPSVSLVSAVYPNGVHAAASSTWWDVRLAVVDQAPVAFWHESYGAARGVNVIAGAGLTPRQGVRIGAAFARGDFARARTTRPALGYAMANIEAEYAFGHTRISGEWTRDTFESLASDRVAHGWTLQAEHALSPRVFVHARATGVRAPEAASVRDPEHVTRTFRSLDSTVGFRVTREVTLRAAYTAIRRFDASEVDHQVGVSAFWSARWW